MCKMFICVFVLLSAMLPTRAQYQQNKVEIIDMDAQMAVFSVEGYGSKKADALQNACMATIYKLLYTGVDGFNDNAPIVALSPENIKKNIWLSDMFRMEKRTYNSFCKNIEVDGEFEYTSNREYHCLVNVEVNYAYLLRMADTNGVTDKKDSPPAAQEKKEEKQVEPAAQPREEKTRRPGRVFL